MALSLPLGEMSAWKRARLTPILARKRASRCRSGSERSLNLALTHQKRRGLPAPSRKEPSGVAVTKAALAGDGLVEVAQVEGRACTQGVSGIGEGPGLHPIIGDAVLAGDEALKAPIVIAAQDARARSGIAVRMVWVAVCGVQCWRRPCRLLVPCGILWVNQTLAQAGA
jgi:hypothetical protein